MKKACGNYDETEVLQVALKPRDFSHACHGIAAKRRSPGSLRGLTILVPVGSARELVAGIF